VKYLIVRPDRVGDVLLTTPLASALRRQDPKAHITWLVREYTAPLLEHNPDVDSIATDNARTPVMELTQRLKVGHFDVAWFVLPRWRTVWAGFRAGIPRRIGPASKWYSLFFTDRVWQHRSRGESHEADYNLDLMKPLGFKPERLPTRLMLTDEERAWAKRTLVSYRVTGEKPVVVLHPGSGGSSERWPLSHFMALGDKLQESGVDVVVTAGPGETYQQIMVDQMRRQPIFIAAGSVSLRELAALYSQADVVVSNSTGPLHMAVALDVPTVSIYSPIPTCHPKRWGPYPEAVQPTGRHGIWVAPVQGEVVRMGDVSVESIFADVRQRLALRGQGASR
jgi:ADP-heptose:LPS heptosyltransferase